MAVRLSLCEHLDRRIYDLDPSRRLFVRDNGPFDLDHGLSEKFADRLTIRLTGQHHLGNAASVAQQQEGHLCQRALMVQPARHADSLPNVCREFGCERSFHPSPPSGPIPDVRARGTRGATALHRQQCRRPHSVSTARGASLPVAAAWCQHRSPLRLTLDGFHEGTPLGRADRRPACSLGWLARRVSHPKSRRPPQAGTPRPEGLSGALG